MSSLSHYRTCKKLSVNITKILAASPDVRLRRRYRCSKSNKQIELFKNSFMGMIKLEVWEYLPRTCRNSSFVISRSVDPISLYLSLRHDDDPRVEIEVDHFKQKINDILGENDGW